MRPLWSPWVRTDPMPCHHALTGAPCAWLRLVSKLCLQNNGRLEPRQLSTGLAPEETLSNQGRTGVLGERPLSPDSTIPLLLAEHPLCAGATGTQRAQVGRSESARGGPAPPAWKAGWSPSCGGRCGGTAGGEKRCALPRQVQWAPWGRCPQTSSPFRTQGQGDRTPGVGTGMGRGRRLQAGRPEPEPAEPGHQ